MYHFIVRLLDPYLLLMLGLVLVALILRWKRRISAKPLVVILIPWLGLFLFSLPAVSFFTLGSLEWSHPPLQTMPPAAEAIVVLGGYQPAPNDLIPHPPLGIDSIYRCLEADRLYQQTSDCPIFVTGGKVNPDQEGPTLAESMADFLQRLQIPAENLVLEERSRSTFENAVETAKLLKSREIQSVVLVTEAIHLPRAIRCFEAQGVTVAGAGCEYKASQFHWEPDSFLPSPSAADGNHQALHEWLGLAWYRLTGKI